MGSPPTDAIGKQTAKKRANDGTNCKHHLQSTLNKTTLSDRHDFRDDNEADGIQATSAESLECTSDNQDSHVGSGAADGGGDDKQGDVEEENGATAKDVGDSTCNGGEAGKEFEPWITKEGGEERKDTDPKALVVPQT